MATMRRGDSKTAIGQQRANLRQSARHKQFVGAGAAEVRKPVSALVADLVGDGVRLARTLVAFPFRLAAALCGRRPSEA